MKFYLKYCASFLAASLILAGTSASAGNVPESDKTIKIMTGDWTSIGLQGEMMQLILQTVGYNAELVVADDSETISGL